MQYEIDGNINQGTISGKGVAIVNPEEGLSILEVEFSSRPRGWDPRTILLMCCSRAVGTVSEELEGAHSIFALSGGVITIGKELSGVFRRASILNSEGQLLADVAAASSTSFIGDNPFDHSTIQGHFSQMEPGETGISEIRDVYGVMLPIGRQLVSLTTTYRILLETGEVVHGFTHYPHYLPSPSSTKFLTGPQAFRLEVTTCEWSERTLYACTRSVVSAMAMPAAIEKNTLLNV